MGDGTVGGVLAMYTSRSLFDVRVGDEILQMIGGVLPRWLIVQYVRDDVVGASEIDGDVEGAVVFDRENGMELDPLRRGYADSFISKKRGE